MDNGRSRSHSISRDIPIEICENIIDQLYSNDYFCEQIDNTRTLRHCALVCKDWRVRSQIRLFYSVVLHDLPAIHQFAAVLETGPHLRDYVHEVILIGRTLQTTACPLWHFPLALHGKLPRLRELRVKYISDSMDWYPRASQLQPGKRLQHLPFHPRFPLFLATFTTITSLVVHNSTFRHFSDIVKMVASLPGLQRLHCMRVWCVALGPLPVCLKPQVEASEASVSRSTLDSLSLVRTPLHNSSPHITSCP